MLRPRSGVLLSIVVAAAAARFLPHPPNITPLAALALFGGAHFSDKRLALLVPLAALFASDILLGQLWHMDPFVYGSLAAIGGIGLCLRDRRSVLFVAGAALTSSVVFFVVTNFGTWATTTLYPHTAAGLEACYVAAIPFFRNTALGDLFYTTVFFGGFALLERAFPLLSDRMPAASATA